MFRGKNADIKTDKKNIKSPLYTMGTTLMHPSK